MPTRTAPRTTSARAKPSRAAGDDAFTPTFQAIRAMLAKAAARSLIVTADAPADFQVSSPTKTDRTGRPLFVAAVQIKKSYVSYHLMPIYMMPAMQAAVPPALRKRMQGKACFNFKKIEPAELAALATLTRTAIEKFKGVRLPWERA